MFSFNANEAILSWIRFIVLRKRKKENRYCSTPSGNTDQSINCLCDFVLLVNLRTGSCVKLAAMRPQLRPGVARALPFFCEEGGAHFGPSPVLTLVARGGATSTSSLPSLPPSLPAATRHCRSRWEVSHQRSISERLSVDRSGSNRSACASLKMFTRGIAPWITRTSTLLQLVVLLQQTMLEPVSPQTALSLNSVGHSGFEYGNSQMSSEKQKVSGGRWADLSYSGFYCRMWKCQF